MIPILFLLLFSSCKTEKETFTSLQLLNPPQYNAYFSYPGREKPEAKKRAVLDKILDKIRNSKIKIEIYAYSFNHPEIIQELKIARQRGVEVHFLLDKKSDYTLLKENEFSLRIWDNSGLHHIKAILFDSKSLFFGTGNFSLSGLTEDWNGYIETELNPEDSIKLIQHLEMKTKDLFLKLPEARIFFSPENGIHIQEDILRSIENAKQSIYYLAFDHYDPIVSHVLKKASARGVEVIGIYNKPVDPEGIYLQKEFYGFLSNIYQDGNANTISDPNSNFPIGGLLHHKTIIIDKNLLLTGSYNFSLSARDLNREMYFTTNNFLLVQAFLKEFERIKEQSYLVNKEKGNYHPEIKEFDENNIKESEICFPDLEPGILEYEDGVFDYYSLYIPDKENCLGYQKREKISTGIFQFSTDKNWEIREFQKGIKYYPRYGNQIYKTVTLSEKKDFKNGVFLDFKNENLDDHLWNIQLDRSIEPIINVSYFLPGKTWEKVFIRTQENDQLSLPVSVSHSDFFFFQIETNKEKYYLCKNKYGKNKSINYLVEKIQIEMAKESKKINCKGE